jgi:hypothetical protein
MDERRIAPRKRTLKSAQIHFNQKSVINCAVRNLSETGACLEVESPMGIPDNFILVIDSETLRRPCVVAWRSMTRIGVAFR